MVKENGRRIPAGGQPGHCGCRWPRHFVFRDDAMPGATRLFRVPCRCSAAVSVGLGQAGSNVLCPDCGATVAVPRLRDLSAFEVREESPQGGAWQVGHAWLLVGGVVALVAALAAGLLSRFDGGASQRLPSESLIRAAVESADAATLHKAWLAVKRSGVDRGAVSDELLVQQAANSVRRVAVLLWGMAAVATLAAAAGGIAILWQSFSKGSVKP